MSKIIHDGPILEIDKLSISFLTRLREIPAVMDFSVIVQPGEAVGLVGEFLLTLSARALLMMFISIIMALIVEARSQPFEVVD